MMHNPWLFVGIISIGLAVPLAYAARTLRHMKHTRFVPIIRTRDRQGTSHHVICTLVLSINTPHTRRFGWSRSATL